MNYKCLESTYVCILAGCMLLPIRKLENVEMLMLYDAIMLE